MIWRQYNWLRRLVVPLLLALLRIVWLVAWLELAQRWLAPQAAAPILSLQLMLGVYLASAVLARLLAGARNLTLARLTEAAAGFAAILLALWLGFARHDYLPWDTHWLTDMATTILGTENAFAPALLALPVIIYLWLQGVVDGRQPLYRDDVWNAFMVGFLGMVAAALAAPLDGRGVPPGMSGLVFGYFAIGMLALALSSVETEQRLAAHSGEGALALNRYWLASVVSVVLVLLGLGALLSAVITPELISRSLSWLSILFELAGRVLYYVLLVLAYLVFLVVGPLLRALDAALRPGAENQPRQLPDFQQQLEDLPQGQAGMPPAVLELLPWLGLAAVILAIGLAFALALRRWQRSGQNEADETREIILTRALLVQQVSQLLGNMLRRGRNREPEIVSPFLSLDDEMDARRAIRRVYQKLLATMAQRGLPRQRGQTPAEYGAAVQRATPAVGNALDVVTSAYGQARYGAQMPDSSQIKGAEQAWRAIEDVLGEQGEG